jgi:hypothetical protein
MSPIKRINKDHTVCGAAGRNGEDSYRTHAFQRIHERERVGARVYDYNLSMTNCSVKHAINQPTLDKTH